MKVSYILLAIFFLLFGFSAFAQPSNNDCINAIPAVFGTDQNFTTVSATTDGPEHPGAPCFTIGNQYCNKEVWYTITAENTGSIEFSTCNSAPFDTRLVVYNPGSSCPPLDEDKLACNDDGPDCENFTSKIDFPVTAGETYLICIGGYDTDETGEGTFGLEEIATPVPPANSNCVDSEELTVVTPEQAVAGEGWVEGNNENAPSVIGGVTCLATGEFYDVWYHFNSGTEDLLTLIMEKIDEDSDYHIQLYKEDCETVALTTDEGGSFEQVCWDQNETTAGSLTLSDFSTAPGPYKLRVVTQITNYIPGSFRLQLVAGEPIGISELYLNSNLILFPNPSTGQFQLNVNETIVNATINITDLQGRIVFSDTGNFTANQPREMDVDLNTGIYLLSLLNQDQKTLAVKKVIVE